ncbi:MAG: CRTAC1 family protein [Cytophagales bacterium]|nr:CRTAC1 family protein [Cytophagales bacterium]
MLVVFRSLIFAQNKYVDVTEDAGINHFFVPFQGTFGGGVCVLDYNNDGHEDLFIAGGAGKDGFYRNNGDGTFMNIIREAGFHDLDTIVTQGAISGDVNKDGLEDIFITAISSTGNEGVLKAPDILYINNGDGTFSNRTKEFGLAENAKFSTGAAFGDINLDGYPDLFVGVFFENFTGRLDRYTGMVSSKSPPAWDLLYINRGGERFEEISYDYGLNYVGLGFGGVFTDYDNDRDLDLLVINDFGYKFTPNKLFRNEYPKKKFTEVSEKMDMDFGMSAMGVAIGDYNNDQWLDYFFSNILDAPFVINQGPNSPFLNKSKEIGASITFMTNVDGRPVTTISWGINFLDSDNDMDLDLFITNGSLNPDEKPIPNLLLENVDGKFIKSGVEAGLSDPSIGRGSVTFDYDNDGDLDLFVVNQKSVSNNSFGYTNLNSRLYRNESQGKNWLKIKLHGKKSDSNGLGSRVVVYAGDNTMVREIDGGSSHESKNSSIAHFGMNSYDTADSVVVKWMGGDIQTLYNVKVNQAVNVYEIVNITVWQKILLVLWFILTTTGGII